MFSKQSILSELAVNKLHISALYQITAECFLNIISPL